MGHIKHSSNRSQGHPATRRLALGPLLALGIAVLPEAARAQEAAPAARQPKTDLSLNTVTEMQAYDISGPGRGTSFYKQGVHFLNEHDIRLRREMRSGWDMDLNVIGRGASSEQIDHEGYSFEKLSLTLKNPANEINAGDYFANFSQYSMNRNLKGGAYRRNLGRENHYVEAIAGTFTPQWEYFYAKRVAETMERYVTGARYLYGGKSFQAGLNLVSIRDWAGDPHRKTENAYDQRLGSLDWEYRFERGWILDGESAFSSAETKPRSGADRLLKKGANRVRARGKFGRTDLTGTFERVEPDFLTLGGSATADRRRARGEIKRPLSKSWSTFLTYERTNDNLYAQRNGTLVNQLGDTGFSGKRLFGRKTLNLQASYRARHRGNGSPRTNELSHRAKLALSDQFGPLRCSGNYEYLFTNDTVGISDVRQNLYNLTLATQHQVQGWQLTPNLYLGTEETDNRATLTSDLSRTIRGGVDADNGKGLRLGASHETVVIQPGSGQDTRTQRSKVSAEYSPRKVKDLTVSLSLTRNDYLFSDHANNYQEKLTILSVRWNFSFTRGATNGG